MHLGEQGEAEWRQSLRAADGRWGGGVVGGVSGVGVVGDVGGGGEV